MAIKKTTDLANETNSKYTKSKTTAKSETITERFDDTTHNDNPYDDVLQYLSKKIDDIIDETNVGTLASGSYAGDIKILKTASGSLSTRVTLNDAKTVLVVGTGSGNAKAGNTTTISSGQASAITANTAKTGTTSTERTRIAANHAKVGISTVQAATVNNLHPEGGAIIPTTTAKHTVSASVTKTNRGVYALVFTMVDGTGRTPVTKTATIPLK